MTREEAIAYWKNHYENGNTDQNDAVYAAIQALETAMVVYDSNELKRIVAQTIKM